MAKRLTEYGKVVRKFRIERGWLLKDMADELKRSASYLSAVETGRKPPSDDVVAATADALALTGVERAELFRAAELSKDSHTIRVGEGQSNDAREVAVGLARGFPGLSPADIADIKNILDKRRA